MTTICGRTYGRSKGSVNPNRRRCVRPQGHEGRHSDLPPLDFLKQNNHSKKAAGKARRDAENSKGVAWPGVPRKNREARWDLPPNHQYYATYETCLEVTQRLTLYIFEMQDAPDCPPDMIGYLEQTPIRGSYVCDICGVPITIEEINRGRRSRSLIETGHKIPFTRGGRHEPDNVFFCHRECNIAQGNKTISEFLDWIASILEFHEYDVSPPD